MALVFVPEVADEPSLGGLATLPAMVPLAVALALLVTGLLLSYKTVKSGALFGATGLALVAVLMPVLTANVLVLAAFVNGLTIPVRSGFINASLGLQGAAARPLFGLAFSIMVMVAAIVLISFFYRVAAEQERIARQTRGDL